MGTLIGDGGEGMVRQGQQNVHVQWTGGTTIFPTTFSNVSCVPVTVTSPVWSGPKTKGRRIVVVLNR